MATEFLTTIYGKIITIAIITIFAIVLIKPKIIAKETYIKPATYPIAASEYINNNLDTSTMKLYNEYNYGSYLLFKDIPVFIDSRADLYDDKFNKGTTVFNDFIDISNINLHYEEKFEKYGITHVIVYKNAKLNLFLAKDMKYRQIYSDDSFVIYERATN